MNRIMIAIVATLVAVWGASTVANAQILFSDDFDSTPFAEITTNTNSSGYKVIGRLSEGPTNPVELDHKVIFGFDYGTVTDAAVIPPAPNSSGGTTKGLSITTNKNNANNNTRTAVHVYPVDGSNVPLSFSGDYSFKFDLWQNWGSGATISASTEQTLYGINHSGNEVNINFSSVPETSDGLFYSLSSNGTRSATDTSLRDFGVYQGAGATPANSVAASLKTTGFTSQLGPNFDNLDPGYGLLFPVRPAFPNLPIGSPAEQWNEGEVRQVGGVISQFLNGTLISQYTNTTAFTSGDIMFGYWDILSTIGQPVHAAIFDNIRVTVIPEPSALALGGIAAAVMGAFVRRRKS